jgi:hypothetical protein
MAGLFIGFPRSVVGFIKARSSALLGRALVLSHDVSHRRVGAE